MAESTRADTLHTDVLVVGAGPTGLMLANWLARCGVDAIVVDGKSGPTRESRALVVQARSMEIYDQLGVVDEVIRAAVPVRQVAPGFGKRVFGRLPIGDFGRGTTPYPSLFVLEQSRNEEILSAHLTRLGGEVLWGHALDALDTTPSGGVLAAVSGPGGAGRIEARFCVGADGSGSAVRRLAGIRFEGATNEHVFFVCDATGVEGLATGAVNVRPARHDVLLSFPMGEGEHHRVLGILRVPGARADVAESAVREMLARVYGVSWRETRWFSSYRVHHRVATEFRRGAVFLAGDAAHVHSPVGAQGMNTGLQDAHNLALALAEVLAGSAPESRLDRYEAERRPVALRLVGTTDRVFAAITSESLPARVVRRALIPLLGPLVVRVVPRLRIAPRLFEYVSQVRIHYRMPGEGPGRGTTVGRRLPYSGDNFAALRSASWQVHAYGAVDPARVADIARRLGLPVHVFRAPSTARLRAGFFYLVRPDGFVAAEAAASGAVGAFRAVLPAGARDGGVARAVV